MGKTAAKAQRMEAPPKSLYIFHMARSPLGRTARRLRPGNRQGFVLDDGVRVRRKGKKRVTEIGFDAAIQNIEKLIDGVKHSYIRVSLDGDGKKPVSLKQLEGLAEPGTLQDWREARKQHVKLVQAQMQASQMRVEQEARLAKAVELETAIAKLDEAASKGEALMEELETLKEATDEAELELEELDEMIAQGRPPEPEESEEDEAAAAEAEAKRQADELDAARKEAQEKAEAEEKARKEAEAAAGGATPAGDQTTPDGKTPEGGGEGGEEGEAWTEESLMALTRTELNTVATDSFKIEDVESYPNKRELAAQVLKSLKGGKE